MAWSLSLQIVNVTEMFLGCEHSIWLPKALFFPTKAFIIMINTAVAISSPTKVGLLQRLFCFCSCNSKTIVLSPTRMLYALSVLSADGHIAQKLNHIFLVHAPCIFYYFVQLPTNVQLFHKLSHSYIFRHYGVTVMVLVISTLPSYTSMSKAVVSNKIIIIKIELCVFS